MTIQPANTPTAPHDIDAEPITEREPNRALWDILAELEEKAL